MKGRFNRLTPTDLMFLRLETDAWPCHFGGFVMLEGSSLFDGRGELRFDDIKRRLDDRLTHVPDMRQRIHSAGPLGGRPVWADDPGFDIGNHVRTVRVPDEGIDLLDLVTEIYAERLDRDRPLWEMWFITGLGDDRAAILLKLHHAVADGLAAIAIMGSLFDWSPDAAQPARADSTPDPAPKWTDLVRDNLVTKTHGLLDGLRAIRIGGLMRSIRSFTSMSRGYFGKQAASASSVNDVVGRGRRVQFVQMDLDAMKRAAHASGGKVNDVILTLWAGGVRRLLSTRGERVDVDLVTGMATTLRPTTGAGDTIDNRVGTMVLRLPLLESDPRVRLSEIIDRTARSKAEARPAATMGYLAAIAGTPLGRSFVSKQKASNTIVTNVMGPAVPAYFLGARIVEILPIIELVGNIGLTLCAFSYCGVMYLVVTADEQAFADLDELMNGMSNDWLVMSSGSGAPRQER